MPRTRDLAALGAMSLLTGLVVGWYPPILGGSTPAAASTPTITPTPIASEPNDREATAQVTDVAIDDNADTAVIGDVTDLEPTVFIPEDQRRSVTIAGVGDILLHKEIIAQAVSDGGGTPDFRSQLEGIALLIESADLAVCHMEYPLGSREGPWSSWPDLPSGPPQIAEAVADVGFDACTTASNHTLDQGFDGVVRTIEALESAGLAHAGSAASEAEAAEITMIDVDGVPVALLSYTYGFNGIPRPYDWCCNLIEPGVITAAAQRARDAGASIVIASLHFGVEGIAPPTESQRVVVQELADSGLVDLVLGHHAHVVQPVTKVGDMWVAYGHGNLLSAQSRKDPRTGDGLLTTFTFAEQADGTFVGTSAIGYAIVNYDFPFSIAPVPSYAQPGGKADATWTRVNEQAIIPGDASGFELRRID
ncbi:MAG: poly-gamma-glutamate synthesis protein involved in capsule biosynthesis [Actinomycetota bacterium]|jgi:poly-gamma-glutamate synthesis protein (capsule biosynthesis protein)